MSIDNIAAKWEGTPHRPGLQTPKVGVDCIRFVDEVLREYGDHKWGCLPRWAQDGAFHNPRVLARIIALCEKRWDCHEISPPYFFQTGDLICVSQSRNPFHIGIVGDDNRVVWHSGAIGVMRTSVQALSTNKFNIRRVYRPRAFERSGDEA